MTEALPLLVDRDDVLPGDATPLERAIADTDGRLDDIDMDLPRRVKAVDEAPPAFLPALAWERSVDVWDPVWPDTIKRAVIRVSPAVHRRKGTRFAVQTALDALGVAVDIVEWWQTEPKGVPYTFKITAYARAKIYDGDFILDPRLINVVYATVMRTKPTSRGFGLAVGAGFFGPLGLAGIGVAVTKQRQAVHAPARIAARQTLGLAAVGVGRVKHRAAITLRAAP